MILTEEHQNSLYLKYLIVTGLEPFVSRVKIYKSILEMITLEGVDKYDDYIRLLKENPQYFSDEKYTAITGKRLSLQDPELEKYWEYIRLFSELAEDFPVNGYLNDNNIKTLRSYDKVTEVQLNLNLELNDYSNINGKYIKDDIQVFKVDKNTIVFHCLINGNSMCMSILDATILTISHLELNIIMPYCLRKDNFNSFKTVGTYINVEQLNLIYKEFKTYEDKEITSNITVVDKSGTETDKSQDKILKLVNDVSIYIENITALETHIVFKGEDSDIRAKVALDIIKNSIGGGSYTEK